MRYWRITVDNYLLCFDANNVISLFIQINSLTAHCAQRRHLFCVRDHFFVASYSHIVLIWAIVIFRLTSALSGFLLLLELWETQVLGPSNVLSGHQLMSKVTIEVLSEAVTVVESHSTNLALKLKRFKELGLCDHISPKELICLIGYLLTERVWVRKGGESVVGLCLWINEVTDGEAKLLIERLKRL